MEAAASQGMPPLHDAKPAAGAGLDGSPEEDEIARDEDVMAIVEKAPCEVANSAGG